MESLCLRFRSWKELIEEDRKKLAEIYLTAWLDNPSFEAVFERLLKVLEKYPGIDEVSEYITFLGTHYRDYYMSDAWDSWFFDNVFFQLFDKQGGYSSYLKEEQIDYMISEKRSREILELIRRAVMKGTDGHLIGKRMVAEVGVVPFLKRKEAFLLNGGFTPIFYPNPVFKEQPVESKLNLYLDVSHSVMIFLPFLYGLIVKLKNEVGGPMYLFSNRVVPVSINEIKEGIVKTTGGTDFDCIAEHALKHQFSRILVITDGFGEFQVFKEQLKKQCEVYVVLTRGYVSSDIIEVAGGEKAENRRWWILKEEEDEC